MQQVIKTIFYFGPLLFGIGFLAPLSAQLIDALSWTPPLGLSPVIAGLIIGGCLGLMAQLRGRWI